MKYPETGPLIHVSTEDYDSNPADSSFVEVDFKEPDIGGDEVTKGDLEAIQVEHSEGEFSGIST